MSMGHFSLRGERTIMLVMSLWEPLYITKCTDRQRNPITGSHLRIFTLKTKFPLRVNFSLSYGLTAGFHK